MTTNRKKSLSMNATRKVETVRLNRYLAMLGVASRRACDEIILSGRVRVDGRQLKELGTTVVPGVSQIFLDNHPLDHPPRPLVLILNKPTGVVSTVSDPEGRRTVIDFCGKYARSRRLFPVGRLDFNTTGAILLTNDGMLCYRLTHPRFQIPRIYHARVRGVMNERKLKKLASFAAPPRDVQRSKPPVELVKELDRESLITITLYEGRNRQVWKMCERVGLRVVKLKRVSFGPVSIRNLPLGAIRPLEVRELDRLNRIIGD